MKKIRMKERDLESYTEQDLYTLFRIYTNLNRMLSVRKYESSTPIISDYNVWKKEIPEGEGIVTHLSNNIYQNKKGQKTKVYWSDHAKFGTNDVKILYEAIKKDLDSTPDVETYVTLIINTSLSSEARVAVESLKLSDAIFIDIFHYTDLIIDKTQNFLVPEHSILPLSKKKEIIQQYGKKLPQILKSDPQAKYLGAKQGQIIKIVRPSSTMKGEKVTSYRVVI